MVVASEKFPAEPINSGLMRLASCCCQTSKQDSTKCSHTHRSSKAFLLWAPLAS